MMHKAGLVEPLRVGKWTYYRRNEETIRAFAEFVQKDL
jgi:DNA-binding transcriptional ArsR family regulator